MGVEVGGGRLMINKFGGKHWWLSNFSLVPNSIRYGDMPYPTVEHAFQAAKTLDLGQRALIRSAATPGHAKRLGREVQLRHDWEEVKFGIMTDLLRQKFALGTKLADKLIATGDERLVEGNYWHDQWWGDCQCPQHQDIPGKNMLGRALVVVRYELRARCDKAAG